MQTIKLIKMDTQQVVGQRIAVANSFFQRFRGLMFRKSLGEYDGLLLTKTKQIHMFWMRFPIDVIYLRRVENETQGQIFEVVGITEGQKPWSIGGWVREATDVLELNVGTIQKVNIKKGDALFSS